jgi:hypothetical protein
MLCSLAGNGVKVHPGIKTDEAALVPHRQAQQVAVCNLPVAQQMLSVHLVGAWQV